MEEGETQKKRRKQERFGGGKVNNKKGKARQIPINNLVTNHRDGLTD